MLQDVAGQAYPHQGQPQTLAAYCNLSSQVQWCRELHRRRALTHKDAYGP